MKKQIILLMLAAACLGHKAIAGESRIIASFEDEDSVKNWISVNDGVMGGISKGSFEYSGKKTILFSGVLSLENNGGFASIRKEKTSLGLSGATGIIVKAKGDGRTYWVDLRSGNQSGASSYRAYLATRKGKWEEPLIPLSEFKPQAFGRQLPGAPIAPESIVSVGFTIADKKAGPFELEIAHIKASIDEIKPQKPAEPLKPGALIELAIERGVPLFNNGDPAACSAVYEITCEALRSMDSVSKKSREDIGVALDKMRTERKDSEKAWILRRALDKVSQEFSD